MCTWCVFTQCFSEFQYVETGSAGGSFVRVLDLGRIQPTMAAAAVTVLALQKPHRMQITS